MVCLPLATIVLLSTVTASAVAQSQSTAGKGVDEWQFTLAPYLIFPWMDGKTSLRSYEVEVDVSPSDIFDNLQFGGMAYFEVRKAKWGTGVDILYMALGTDVARPSANVDMNQGAYTFQGLRELNDRVDLVFGARWNVLDGKIEFKGPSQLTVEQTRQWVDPIVGLKLRQPLGGRWHFTMQGDIGGFGAGADFSWHLFPVIGADVGKRATLGVGYRVLGMDYEAGDAGEAFKYDVITQGIIVGMAFRF